MNASTQPTDRFLEGRTPQDHPFLRWQGDVLRALGHPVRLRIIEHLRRGEHCVCDFEPLLGLRQPNISQHLAMLRAANLVHTRRVGRVSSTRWPTQPSSRSSTPPQRSCGVNAPHWQPACRGVVRTSTGLTWL
ncbi:MAG: metalloregulator ArsR/SmtB family transcription factor [Anaerolineae bacterium]|nr:metalloregulator ArsR/SmtB family transcription factor [Anaerolineae bacterium]